MKSLQAVVVTSAPLPGIAPRVLRFVLLIAAGALPAACFSPELPPRNPFVGTWATAERQQVAFRDDTVVLNPPNQPPTAMAPETCEGAFRFGYARKSREALIGLVKRQPDITRKLQGMLVQPDYPVAEVRCGEGDSTYVLLNDREAVAIFRDHDIAGLEQLNRL